MQYRKLGNTDIECSVVGFGVWTVTAGWWGNYTAEEAIRLMRKAYELGVTVFDTAPTYGPVGYAEEIVARALISTHRGLVTTEWQKSKRHGVLIDSNQNGEGKTIASVYSVRPKPGAPVSTPLRWEEVTEDLDPRDFTMETVLARIERHGDLYEGALTTRQRLAQALDALR